jgi:hypothetical protein
VFGSWHVAEAEPEPCETQSDGQLVAVSPVSHVPLPHTACTFEPLFDPFEPWLEPLPQSCGQLFTSLAAQVPSPQCAPVVPIDASTFGSDDDAPPQLQATANESAPATAHTIPEEVLIMRGIILIGMKGSTEKGELPSS